VTTVLLGNPPSGADLAAGGLLLRDRHGVTHLLAEGRRFALAGRAVLNALNYTGTTPIAVPDAWLDAVPAGTDLRFPVVPGRGGKPRWRSPAGVLVGHILRVGDVGTSTRYFLVERTGLRPLGATGTALALGDPAAASAYGDDPVRPVPVSPSALLGAPDAPAPTAPANYPNRPPDLLEVPRSDVAAICVPVAGNGAPATPRLVPVDALTARSPIPVAGPATGPREVVVPAGGGALVRAGGTDGMVFLVTDQGSRFPVPDPAARTALGYGGATPVEMPAAVIGLLPPGPALDRAAAARISTG
jgi:type VII secretion protein EccB